ncbi:MAG: hypothetical protein SFY66_11260 [Oculatellaceae cyanobacterium bins.114]|nr:hypothetical protein [Oculatellaceae cyanobacterium bins.114]
MKLFIDTQIFLTRIGAYLLRKLKLKKSFSPTDLEIPPNFESQDPSKRFTKRWFTELYQELGDGSNCYQPPNVANYDGGALKACHCCPANVRLHLLPNEEKMFVDVINDWDFRLAENPNIPGRKAIYCNKLGLCGGHKPFVCRTHPVYFSEGSLLVQESLCRLPAYKFFQFHHDQVEHIRRIVLKYGLDKVTLGYGRIIRLDDGQESLQDFHC